MMRTFLLLLTLVVLCSSLGLAGEIFGTLREGGKAVAKDVKVEIVTPKKTYATVTDAYGSYRLYVVEKGKCTLNVYYKTQTASLELYAYDKSTRYDMSLEVKDGKYLIKRK